MFYIILSIFILILFVIAVKQTWSFYTRRQAENALLRDNLHDYVVREIKSKLPNINQPNWMWYLKTGTRNGRRIVILGMRNIMSDEEKFVHSVSTEWMRTKGYYDTKFHEVCVYDYANGDARVIKQEADELIIGKTISKAREYLLKNRPDEETYEIL